jgi:hypothetical protein
VPRLWKLEVQMRRAVASVLFLAVMTFLGCSTSSRLCTYTINADVKCRICDTANDGRTLVEYFNTDTNELRLFVTDSEFEVEILHPFGEVHAYSEKVSANSIKFDGSDSKLLLVNGERFSITPKNTLSK